jgi:hypothetical protein
MGWTAHPIISKEVTAQPSGVRTRHKTEGDESLSQPTSGGGVGSVLGGTLGPAPMGGLLDLANRPPELLDLGRLDLEGRGDATDH